MIKAFQTGRVVACAVGLGLVAEGLLFLRVLVANWSDNAYLGLAIIGVLLLVAVVPWLIAAAVSSGRPRRVAIIAALVLLSAVVILGVVILVQGLLVIPSQHYADSRILRNHVAGLSALLVTAVTVWMLVVRSRR